MEVLSYDYQIDSWKLLLTSSKNCTIETISFTIGADNDDSDWINGFFEDYDHFYYEEEVIGVYSNLIANVPITITFSSKTLQEFTLENIEKYIEDIRNNPDLMFDEDKETCIESFIDPQWNMTIMIEWTELWSTMIPYENTEIIDYMNSL